jgi:protein-S-isoprenylcysteine O-methyltransferase Ste14
MNEFRSRPLNFPWPPLIYVLACAAALLLGMKMPIISFHILGGFGKIIGATFMAMAIALDLWALKTLFERHTAIMPHKCATHLVTCGPFHYTRNPIYLGYTLMTLGIGLVLGNGWFAVAALVAALATHFLAIRREEFHLLSRFGFEFERYCRQTRCWI